jgi:hypothetical protein
VSDGILLMVLAMVGFLFGREVRRMTDERTEQKP